MEETREELPDGNVKTTKYVYDSQQSPKRNQIKQDELSFAKLDTDQESDNYYLEKSGNKKSSADKFIVKPNIGEVSAEKSNSNRQTKPNAPEESRYSSARQTSEQKQQSMVKALEKEKDYRVADRTRAPEQTSDSKKPTFRERVGDRDDRKVGSIGQSSSQKIPPSDKSNEKSRSYSKQFHEGSTGKKHSGQTNRFEPQQQDDNNETTIYEDDQSYAQEQPRFRNGKQADKNQESQEEADEEVIFRETLIKPSGETIITERITKSPGRLRKDRSFKNQPQFIENDDRERSITKSHFSPERDVTETTFYPSGNTIRTIIERNQASPYQSGAKQNSSNQKGVSNSEFTPRENNRDYNSSSRYQKAPDSKPSNTSSRQENGRVSERGENYGDSQKDLNSGQQNSARKNAPAKDPKPAVSSTKNQGVSNPANGKQDFSKPRTPVSNKPGAESKIQPKTSLATNSRQEKISDKKPSNIHESKQVDDSKKSSQRQSVVKSNAQADEGDDEEQTDIKDDASEKASAGKSKNGKSTSTKNQRLQDDAQSKTVPKKATQKSSKQLSKTDRDMRECVYKINTLLENTRDVEEKKIDLALRFDFVTPELFKVIAKNDAEFITVQSLAQFLKSGRIWNDDDSVQDLVSKFDKDEDGQLNLQEFSDLISPYSEEYRKQLAERKGRGISNYSDYTLQTRKALKVAVAALFDNIASLPKSKQEEDGELDGDALSKAESEQQSVVSRADSVQQIQTVINQLYDQLKERYDGDEITMNDIADELAEYGLNSTFRELCVLFTDLNLNLDGKLNTEEYKELEGESPAEKQEDDIQEETETRSNVTRSQKSRATEAELDPQDGLSSKRSLRSQHQSRVSGQQHHDSELDDEQD